MNRFLTLVIPMTALALILCPFESARANLSAVSGEADPAGIGVGSAGEPETVAVSLANGFPLWYSDGTLLDGETPLKLAQCRDAAVTVDGIAGSVDPCAVQRLFPQFPPSLINPSEVLYWQAESGFNYVSSEGGGSALLVLALEGGGANENPLVDGNQAVFTRIRLRVDVPVAGTYRVTHPFGTYDYVVTRPGSRAIDQTQDIGVDQAQNFLAALRGREAFTIPTPFDPAEDDGGAVVNADGGSIGPFLVPALDFSAADLKGGPLASARGSRYIGLPVTPGFEEILQPLAGSPTNFFRIELRDPPAGFQLNPGAAEPQVLQADEFMVLGKMFDDGPNRPPAAPEVTVGVLKGRTSVDIDVFEGRDIAPLDPVNAEDNVHGVDPQAVALADPQDGVFRSESTGMPLLSAPQVTPSGGTVRRISRLATGQSLFRYDIPLVAGDAFTDTFHFVVQDTGGLLSEPASVTVVVEDLRITHADFRVKTGKWHIRGSSDQSAGNAVALFAEPRARLDGAGTAVQTSLSGSASLAPRESSMDYHIRIDGMSAPAEIEAVTLHVEGPGNPAVFRLCGNPFISPFPPSCDSSGGFLEIEGALTGSDLLPAPVAGITAFTDAADAILRGEAYVNVATAAHPEGEIRGELEARHIGVAPVNAEGEWEFRGRGGVVPGHLGGVSARSALGVRTSSVPVSLR